MTAPDVPADARPVPRWGLGDALLGWLGGNLLGAVASIVVLGAAGYTGEQVRDNEVPLWVLALQYPPLWVGFIGVPLWAAAVKGRGWVRDFHATIRGWDVPVAAGIGLLTQLVVVPLVSWPVLWLSDTDVEELGRPARELGDLASGPWNVVLLFAVVGIGAPIAEELFFRGLVLRAFEKRIGTGWAVVASSVVFGATHVQPLQFVALTAAGVVFALLVVRTGRLGAAVVAHMAFNCVTVANLVWGPAS